MEASYPDLAPDTLGAESFRVTCSQKNAQEKKPISDLYLTNGTAQ